METHQHHPPHQHHSQHHQQQHQPTSKVVSHWTKTTPEEGIQLVFSKADTDKNSAGSRVLTSPTSTERPCQWDICLRLVSSPFSPPFSDASISNLSTTASLPGTRSDPTVPTPPRRTSPQNQQQTNTSLPSTLYHRTGTPLLALTLQRAGIRLSSAGHGHGGDGNGQDEVGGGGGGGGENMGFEDPMNPGRARCDSYRTIYIYSPRLRRDIHVQPINRDIWPQTSTFFVLGRLYYFDSTHAPFFPLFGVIIIIIITSTIFLSPLIDQ